MIRSAYVFGHPVAHSLSPALHTAGYAACGLDAHYRALDVAPRDLPGALERLRAERALGANVTAPHKQAVARLCDRLDPLAALVGAVNTIVVDGAGVLTGHNTDVGGFLDALVEAGSPSGAGAIAVVLGAGGASRAVIAALASTGTCVHVVARRPERAAGLISLGAARVLPWTDAALADACAGATLVVDATALFSDALWPAPVPLSKLARAARVVSLSYGRESLWLAQARAAKLATQDGLPMLLHQAARAFTLMTGFAAPLAAMRAALDGAARGSRA